MKENYLLTLLIFAVPGSIRKAPLAGSSTDGYSWLTPDLQLPFWQVFLGEVSLAESPGAQQQEGRDGHAGKFHRRKHQAFVLSGHQCVKWLAGRFLNRGDQGPRAPAREIQVECLRGRSGRPGRSLSLGLPGQGRRRGRAGRLFLRHDHSGRHKGKQES